MMRPPGKRWYWSCLWSALSTVLALILANLSILHSIEFKTLDARFRQFPDPGAARRDIVLIVVDEESVQQLQSVLGRWPWPRDAYALLLDFLRAGGARIVAFDILFAEPHLEKPEGDRAFAQAIARAGNVYLAAAFHEREIAPASTARPSEAMTLQGIAPLVSPREFRGITLPLPRLLAAAKGIGGINIDPDEDGILRRLPTSLLYQGHLYPTLSLAAALAEGTVTPAGILPRGIKNRSGMIPVDPEGRILLTWRGGIGTFNTFQA